MLNTQQLQKADFQFSPHPFLLLTWSAVRSYRRNLVVKGSIWTDDCSHNLHQTVFYLRLSVVFFKHKVNVKRSEHNLRFHIITISISRPMWQSGQMIISKGHGQQLARPLFWPQPMAPWTAGIRFSWRDAMLNGFQVTRLFASYM